MSFRLLKLFVQQFKLVSKIFYLFSKFPLLRMWVPFFSECGFSELWYCFLTSFVRRTIVSCCRRHFIAPLTVFQSLFQLFPSKSCSSFPLSPRILAISSLPWAGPRGNSDFCWFCQFLSDRLFEFFCLDISPRSGHKASIRSTPGVLGWSPRRQLSLFGFGFQGQNWVFTSCPDSGEWPFWAIRRLKSRGGQKTDIWCRWIRRNVCLCQYLCRIVSVHHPNWGQWVEIWKDGRFTSVESWVVLIAFFNWIFNLWLIY